MFSLHADKYEKPTLVTSTDGVGTKLKLAFMADKHDTVGIDLVAMCVNDIVVQGAEPLFFLDYMATGKLTPEKGVEVVKGISDGCIEAGCALIGGETAEMPGFYGEGEYDLAGFTVGIVDNCKIIDGSTITVGDRLIGLASSGLHSNGYSLVRKILFEKMGLTLDSQLDELDKPLGEELLTPTRIYVKTILNLLRDFQIKGMAHITGGGLVENVPRVLPKNCQAIIDKDSWPKPAIFEILRRGGDIDELEMYRTLNYGIGMVLIVPEREVDDIMVRLTGLKEQAYVIGRVAKDETGESVILN
ncbi:MAG: phosphoribosylformylglycinamidine cyclo-ligase [Syntrophotaleaceae bacterium]